MKPDTSNLCPCGRTASVIIDGVYHLCGVHAVAYYDRIKNGENPSAAMQAVLAAAKPK